MSKKKIKVLDSNVLIMGFTFKENCPDIRNTRVIDLFKSFQKLNCNVEVYDPWVDKDDVLNQYGFKPIIHPIKGKYDAIIIAVAHDKFREFKEDKIRVFGRDNHVIYDIKYLLKSYEVDGRL